MCAPGLTPRLGLSSFMARHVPSQAGNVTHDLFVTLVYRCHLSIASALWVSRDRRANQGVLCSPFRVSRRRACTGASLGQPSLTSLTHVRGHRRRRSSKDQALASGLTPSAVRCQPLSPCKLQPPSSTSGTSSSGAQPSGRPRSERNLNNRKRKRRRG